MTPNTSGFIEVPARFLNPTLNRNTYGFSDINLGFKHAFVAEPDRFYTFQFRTYVPTGSGERGLGTNHASLEPAFLVFQRLSDRLYFSGELRDWIPVHGSDFAGNVLRYGAGLAYNVVLTDSSANRARERIRGLDGPEREAAQSGVGRPEYHRPELRSGRRRRRYDRQPTRSACESDSATTAEPAAAAG